MKHFKQKPTKGTKGFLFESPHVVSYSRWAGPNIKNKIMKLFELLCKNSLLALLIAIFIGLLFFSAPGAKADSQGYPSTFFTATNLPATMPTDSISNNLASWLPLYNTSGLGLAWGGNVSSGTSPIVMQIYSSIDGTNISTVPFATWTVTATGTTPFLLNTNWSNLQLKGIKALVIGSITNENGGTFTNNGVLANRPNN